MTRPMLSYFHADERGYEHVFQYLEDLCITNLALDHKCFFNEAQEFVHKDEIKRALRAKGFSTTMPLAHSFVLSSDFESRLAARQFSIELIEDWQKENHFKAKWFGAIGRTSANQRTLHLLILDLLWGQ